MLNNSSFFHYILVWSCFWSLFPKTGPKLNNPRIPKLFFFLVEKGFSSVYKSYLSVLNSFYINSTTIQKVMFFGPYLVPFPENGIKKCVVSMTIAIFLLKNVENMLRYPILISAIICKTIQVFFIWFQFGPDFAPFSRKRDQI